MPVQKAMQVGQTRHGKRIVFLPGESLDEFVSEATSWSSSDQFDVFCAAQWLMIWCTAQYYQEHPYTKHWRARCQDLERFLTARAITFHMQKLHLKETIDLVIFGRSLVWHCCHYRTQQ